MNILESVKRFDGLILPAWCDLYKDFINSRSTKKMGVGQGAVKENVRNVEGLSYNPEEVQHIINATKEEKIKSIPTIFIGHTIIKQLSIPLLNYQVLFKDLISLYLLQVDFLKYGEGGKYEVHTDQGDNSRRRIMTVIINLNEDYEGGEFEFYNPINDKNKIHEEKLKKGSVLMFPSNFMYPHSVRPITKGERFSLVCWMG